jgi:hypothetical protein
VLLPILLEYLLIANEQDLPDLWYKWANSNKQQEFYVLKDSLAAFARSNEAFCTTSPIVTAKLVQDLLSFNFVGDSADDISTGLHPFLITDGNAEQRHGNLEVARLYGLLTSGDVNCSLSDLDALKARETRSILILYWELEQTLGMFGNSLSVTMGRQHPLTSAFHNMWQLLKSGMHNDLHAAIEYKAYVMPTHVLRSVQLECHAWFSHRRARLTPPQPELVSIIQQILRQVYILPHLPPSLYQLAYPKKMSPHPTLPGAVSTGPSGNSGSDASTVLTLTGLVTRVTPQPT